MKRVWIKLYLEMLDDPKLGPLQAWLKWRFVELLLVAAESDKEGMLPSLSAMAWRLRVSQDDLLKSLGALDEAGVVCLEGGCWKVTNFSKRQYSESYERVKRYRARESNADGNVGETGNESISTSSSDSSSPSVDEGGAGGETHTADLIFMDAFGQHLWAKEVGPWRALVEKHGAGTMRDVVTWMAERNIHFDQRYLLMEKITKNAASWKEFGKGPRRDKPGAKYVGGEYGDAVQH